MTIELPAGRGGSVGLGMMNLNSEITGPRHPFLETSGKTESAIGKQG